jgi:phosphoenolpyruvate carboxylase
LSNSISKSFRELVELKYQLYNSLFLTLDFDAIEKTGDLLPLLQKVCRKGLETGDSPIDIIDYFLETYRPEYSENDKISFLFNLIQYIERQIVLVDALEEAAYKDIHTLNGANSWEHVSEHANSENKKNELAKLLSDFGIRVVLTAHPTQFYPDRVLTIIKDLKDAISKNKISLIRDLLKQLGKTPFLNKEKPDPLNEALSLTGYLKNVFYPAVGKLIDNICVNYSSSFNDNSNLIKLGFWPGGDRDGNPYVTVDTTIKIASKLRQTALGCYYKDLKKLKRRLSFSGVYEKLDSLESLLSQELMNKPKKIQFDLSFFLGKIDEIEQTLINDHQSLFLDKLVSFKRRVKVFGFYMASIDIRQDSRVIRKTLEAIITKHPTIFPKNLFELPKEEQINILLNAEGEIFSNEFSDPLVIDTIDCFRAIMQIQASNGEEGCQRYIISNCRGPIDIATIFSLFKLCGWGNKKVSVDIVPLFETIDDLVNAKSTMSVLYNNSYYKEHLSNRSNSQTVMLGFSDGTKDGGYLMANWAIYKAKESISEISRLNDIRVIFFDGRGGPPARGGGSTHLFYEALGKNIESRQIQLTVQGQTINTQYGTIDAAKHNLENLLTAGLGNKLSGRSNQEFSSDQRKLMDDLADTGYKSYESLKKDPLFMPYLNEKSILKYFGKANIGSRPVKRGNSGDFKFEDLRAIPFVGAWSQLKQNVPGFFGVGSALKKQEDNGKLSQCIDLYNKSLFFRALISNSMQSMSKTYFPLTAYLKNDQKFGEFWQKIYDEYILSRKMILKISGSKEFLEDNPRSRKSIHLREEIVLPLLSIQQYALMKVQEESNSARPNTELKSVYEKMIIRTMFGNINAGRNSA